MHFDGEYAYEGRSSYQSDIVCTYDGEYLYNRRSTYQSDIRYTTSSRLPFPVLMMMVF